MRRWRSLILFVVMGLLSLGAWGVAAGKTEAAYYRHYGAHRYPYYWSRHVRPHRHYRFGGYGYRHRSYHYRGNYRHRYGAYYPYFNAYPWGWYY